MLANIKFKSIEELKMTRAEDYDYDKFLSDSSDDHPKYDEGLDSDNCKNFYIKQADDDMFYQQAFSEHEVRTALKNVLGLAENAWALQADWKDSYDNKDIEMVRDYFFHSGEAVYNNSQIAQNNKE